MVWFWIVLSICCPYFFVKIKTRKRSCKMPHKRLLSDSSWNFKNNSVRMINSCACTLFFNIKVTIWFTEWCLEFSLNLANNIHANSFLQSSSPSNKETTTMKNMISIARISISILIFLFNFKCECSLKRVTASINKNTICKNYYLLK